MLRLAGFLVCATLEEADRLSHLLPAHLAEAQAAPGCLAAEVWRSREDPARFAVLYRFRDRAAWERHLAARPASPWWQAVGPLAEGLRLEEGE